MADQGHGDITRRRFAKVLAGAGREGTRKPSETCGVRMTPIPPTAEKREEADPRQERVYRELVEWGERLEEKERLKREIEAYTYPLIKENG